MLNFLLVFCSSCFGLEHHGKCVLHPSILHFGILRPWLFIDLSLFPISLIFFSFFLLFFIFSSYSPIFCFVSFLKKKYNDLSFALCDVLLFGCRLSLPLCLPSLPPSPTTSTSMASSHTPLQQVVVLYTAILMLLLAVVSSYMCT